MRKIKFPILVSILLFALAACQKIETLPAIPRIEYRSFTVYDTIDPLGNHAKAGKLKFYFEDGDGNIGLKDPSTNLGDSTNLFFKLFRKEGGVMTEAPGNDPLNPSSYRIPYMSRLGQNKILKGTISVIFLYLFYEPSDTIKYDFYLKDRTENSSNTESTGEIILSVNNIY
jgi:hypothetical protein